MINSKSKLTHSDIGDEIGETRIMFGEKGRVVLGVKKEFQSSLLLSSFSIVANVFQFSFGAS
jgi:hypothetical protein